MRVRFWGTRGSIAKPGPSTVRYGGNTSCLELRTAKGTLIVIDCGTGAHGLGQSLLAGGAQRHRGHMLIGHTHWDHIQGIPFFAPFFVPGNEWDVYGPKGLGQSLRETLAGQMEYTYFPVTLDQFGAEIRYNDLVEGTFEIDDVRITTHYLNHPALTLGFRIEADGATIAYACDHEPHSRDAAGGQSKLTGHDLQHAEFFAGADLLIHAAQYTAEEYPAKVNWGHSPVEYAVAVAKQAGAKRIALTHHDPLRDDDGVDRLLERLRAQLREEGSSLDVFAAIEGTTVEVTGPAHAHAKNGASNGVHASYADHTHSLEPSVLLGVRDPKVAAILGDAMRAEGLRASVVVDAAAAKEALTRDHPSVAILEHTLPQIDGMEICRTLRADDAQKDLPIIVVAGREDAAAGTAAGVTDWLITPFSGSYARTKMRAWVMRETCRWSVAPLPADEDERLEAVKRLGLLDTPPEPRFDRISRVAASLFDVPIAAIALMDRDREFFKSSVGATLRETSREASFCAHAIFSGVPLVVPDALEDDRFADNPLVIGEPRIRFYAGVPLSFESRCVGTLSLVDTRPRAFSESQLLLLDDMRRLAETELANRP